MLQGTVSNYFRLLLHLRVFPCFSNIAGSAVALDRNQSRTTILLPKESYSQVETAITLITRDCTCKRYFHVEFRVVTSNDFVA